MDKPHRPEPITSHDPYPARPDVDPMAERRRNSGAFYDEVDAAIAARPKRPTFITDSKPVEHGYRITVDDGEGTLVEVTQADKLAPLVLHVANNAAEDATVELGAFTVTALVEVLRRVARLTPDNAAPITGSR